MVVWITLLLYVDLNRKKISRSSDPLCDGDVAGAGDGAGGGAWLRMGLMGGNDDGDE